MPTGTLYNAHFEISPVGHVTVARSCGEGWWEEWVYVPNYEWRRLAELLLEGRISPARQRSAAASRGSRMPPQHDLALRPDTTPHAKGYDVLRRRLQLGQPPRGPVVAK
jgi:hypothetical protein